MTSRNEEKVVLSASKKSKREPRSRRAWMRSFRRTASRFEI